MWICQRSVYFKFILSTQTHIPTHADTHACTRMQTHTLSTFSYHSVEDREPTGLKVDIADIFIVGQVSVGVGRGTVGMVHQDKQRQTEMGCPCLPQISCHGNTSEHDHKHKSQCDILEPPK